MTKAGEKIIEGLNEALAIARGEQPAGAIWHNGFRYVPEGQWATMDTAPKDGEQTLLFWWYYYPADRYPTCGMKLCTWGDGRWVDEEGGHSENLFSHWMRPERPAILPRVGRDWQFPSEADKDDELTVTAAAEHGQPG